MEDDSLPERPLPPAPRTIFSLCPGCHQITASVEFEVKLRVFCEHNVFLPFEDFGWRCLQCAHYWGFQFRIPEDRLRRRRKHPLKWIPRKGLSWDRFHELHRRSVRRLVVRTVICLRCDASVTGLVPRVQTHFRCHCCDAFFESPYRGQGADERECKAHIRRWEERHSHGFPMTTPHASPPHGSDPSPSSPSSDTL